MSGLGAPRASAILPASRLGTAPCSEVFTDPMRPANMARFILLNPRAGDFFANWRGIANNVAAILRAEAGRDPRRPPPPRSRR